MHVACGAVRICICLPAPVSAPSAVRVPSTTSAPASTRAGLRVLRPPFSHRWRLPTQLHRRRHTRHCTHEHQPAAPSLRLVCRWRPRLPAASPWAAAHVQCSSDARGPRGPEAAARACSGTARQAEGSETGARPPEREMGGQRGGGLAQGLGIRLFAFGGACWPLATAHSDPLWARTCFGCVNGAPG